MSNFRIRIEDVVNGRAALLIPGSQGERDLIDDVVAATVAQGVGVFRTQAQVETALRNALTGVLRNLKREVLPS